MQSSMDANEEGFLNCARYGLMLANGLKMMLLARI